jgi:hypothetical protein
VPCFRAKRLGDRNEGVPGRRRQDYHLDGGRSHHSPVSGDTDPGFPK